MVSNARGPTRALHLAGAAVRDLVVWAPCSGSIALGITPTSYAGHARIGGAGDACHRRSAAHRHGARGRARGAPPLRERDSWAYWAIVRPVLIPTAERLGLLALSRRGVSTRNVDTPLGKVHAYDARGKGDLPTTILLHGLGSAATPFAPVLARLQNHVRRIVAPDYPGHGFSENARAKVTPETLFESVGTALDALVPEPCVVVGNSLGGAVALHYALTRPDRVRAVVLLSPAGAHSTDEEWKELRRAFDVKTRSSARELMGRIYHRPPWFLSLLAHEFPATLGRKEVREILESATNDHAPSPDALRAMPMPVLLVWGQSERLLPESHFHWYRRHLPPHAVIERPEGFGHCPHFDAPGRLTRRIVSFIRESVRDPDHLQRSAAVG